MNELQTIADTAESIAKVERCKQQYVGRPIPTQKLSEAVGEMIDRELPERWDGLS